MLALLIGGGLLVIAVCAALAARAVRRRVRVMTATETLTVEQLRQLHQAASAAAGPGEFRYRCEVVGAARPALDEPLVSQLKQLPCVWSRHRITHKYWEQSRDRNGQTRRRQREKVVAEHTSEQPVRVEDATGSVPVLVPKKGVHAPEKVLNKLDKPGKLRVRTLRVGLLSLSLPQQNNTIGYQQEEWVVRPGRRLYAHGEATDETGELVIGPPTEGGPHIVSTQSEERLLADARRKLSIANWTWKITAGGGAVAVVTGGILTLVS